MTLGKITLLTSLYFNDFFSFISFLFLFPFHVSLGQDLTQDYFYANDNETLVTTLLFKYVVFAHTLGVK